MPGRIRDWAPYSHGAAAALASAIPAKESVYWGGNDPATFLWKASRVTPGPAMPLVATGGVLEVKVVGSTVLYAVPFTGSTTGVGWVQTDGTSPMFRAGELSTGIDSDGTNAYWVDVKSQSVRKAPLATGVASSITSTSTGANGVAYAGGNLYLFEGNRAEMIAVSTTTGAITTLGAGTGEPEYPIVNGPFIYSADVNGTAIYKTYR